MSYSVYVCESEEVAIRSGWVPLVKNLSEDAAKAEVDRLIESNDYAIAMAGIELNEMEFQSMYFREKKTS